MKEETKELLVRIKVVLNNYVTQSFNKEELEERNEFRNKAVQFLDSLPEIESRLCQGGYIQDRDGTPCCNGDWIVNRNILDDERELGLLYWSVRDRRFYAEINGALHCLSNNFEKVKPEASRLQQAKDSIDLHN
jgi:hypothetical protein